MQEQPNYYAILPAEVRYNKNISSLAKLIYAELTSLSQKEGYAWATNQYFANLYGVHKKTISGIIGDLIQEKLIKVEIDESLGNVRKVWLLPLNHPIQPKSNPIAKKVYTYSKKSVYPIAKKVYSPIYKNNNKMNNINNMELLAKNEPSSIKNIDHRGEDSVAKEKLRQWFKDKYGKDT